MVKFATQQCLALSFFLLVLAALPVTVQASEQDPIEPFNRVVFAFNDTLDRWLLKPVATAYDFVMPEFAEQGVRNFFANLGDAGNVVHNALQGKLNHSAQSLGRFAINSTVGIGGLFDVASHIGIDRHAEDLGQTLGHWGLGPGPYLVLPLLGPSTLRDSTGVLVDPLLNPLVYAPLQPGTRTATVVLDSVQVRADLLSAESLKLGDTYLLYREAYLSKRAFDVQDGRMSSDRFLDDSEFGDTEDEFLDETF